MNTEAIKESQFAQCSQRISVKIVPKLKGKDTLLANAQSKFERQLIREGRADGISDGEIFKWLKQL